MKRVYCRLSRMVLSVGLIAFICFAVGCDNTARFSGSKTGNEHQFLVDFDVLNTTVSGKMSLSEGDAIATTICVENGRVDVIVRKTDGTVAYQGNDAKTCEFLIEIEEGGTYTFDVTGFQAEGNVHFVKQTRESPR